MPILAWNVPLTSPVYLKRSLAFPFLLFSFLLSIVHLGRSSYLSVLFCETLHSVGCVFPFFPWLLLLFSPQLFVKLPQTTILPFYISLTPIQCHKSPSIVLQVLPWIYSSPLLCNQKGFDLGHSWMAPWFSLLFFNLSLNFAIKSSWS